MSKLRLHCGGWLAAASVVEVEELDLGVHFSFDFIFLFPEASQQGRS